MTFREFTGKNVEEAIRSAMKEFESDLSELDIEILSQGSRGILGVGGEEARILAAPRSAVAAAPSVREATPSMDEAAPRPSAEPGQGVASTDLEEDDAAADQAIELARAEENRRRRGGRGRGPRVRSDGGGEPPSLPAGAAGPPPGPPAAAGGPPRPPRRRPPLRPQHPQTSD